MADEQQSQTIRDPNTGKLVTELKEETKPEASQEEEASGSKIEDKGE